MCVIFNAEGMGSAVSDLAAMFGAGGLSFITGETIYYVSLFIFSFSEYPFVSEGRFYEKKKYQGSRLCSFYSVWTADFLLT